VHPGSRHGLHRFALLPLAFARPAPEEALESAAHSHPDTRRAHKDILALGVVVAVIGGVTEAAFSGLFPIFGVGRKLGADQMVTLLTVFGLGGLLLQYLAGWLADHRGLGFAILVNAASTVLIAVIAALPLGFGGLAITLFALGGHDHRLSDTGHHRLHPSRRRRLSVNVRLISMAYTASSIFGPLSAGAVMNTFSSEALIWLIGLLAAVLCAYLLVKSWSGRA